MPRIMIARKTCTVAKTVITGPSHALARQIRIFPSTTCQKVQSRNEPSCPSQKQLAMYFIGMARLLCFQT